MVAVIMGLDTFTHRVDRVLGFFSSRVNWDPSLSHPLASVSPTPLFRGWGCTLACGSGSAGGGGGPGSDGGPYTAVT